MATSSTYLNGNDISFLNNTINLYFINVQFPMCYKNKYHPLRSISFLIGAFVHIFFHIKFACLRWRVVEDPNTHPCTRLNNWLTKGKHASISAFCFAYNLPLLDSDIIHFWWPCKPRGRTSNCEVWIFYFSCSSNKKSSEAQDFNLRGLTWI